MAWIQVDAGIREHDKIFNLADALKITDAHAVGLMVCLWTWAVTAAPDGDIKNFPPRAIAKAAGWDKKPEVFFEAICSPASMFVEKVDGRLVFRNWDERAALLMDAVERGREKTRQRVQRYRERKAGKENVTDDTNDADVTVGNDGVTRYGNDCNDTVTEVVTDVTRLPNQTIPNQTINNTVLSEQGSTSAASGDEAAATKSDPVPFVKLRDLYNSTCTRLPKIKTIEGERRKAVSARYSTYGFEGFRALFEKANDSNFLCGENKRNWKADFDWLINVTNMVKVLEDKYINSQNPQPSESSKAGTNRNGVNTMGVLDSIINGGVTTYENGE